ncbi:MAG: hypothetical protein HOP11_07225 [Saprospiraceae bacterium]|nr:hypothetical protein [Saprospiraceae bacterium]
MKIFASIIVSLAFSPFINPIELDCSKMLFFNEGASITLNTYDKDRKQNGTIKYRYSKVKSTAQGASTTVNTEILDKKGKVQSTNEFEMECKSGSLFFDFKSLMPEQNQKPLNDMEMMIEGNQVEYPSSISIGQNLKDAQLKISYKAKSNGNPIPMMSTAISITNRKVEAKESISTAAGTFECYKISEDFEFKTLFKIKGKTVSWFNYEVGMVKSESYKENGKFTGSTELVELKK